MKHASPSIKPRKIKLPLPSLQLMRRPLLILLLMSRSILLSWQLRPLPIRLLLRRLLPMPPMLLSRKRSLTRSPHPRRLLRRPRLLLMPPPLPPRLLVRLPSKLPPTLTPLLTQKPMMTLQLQMPPPILKFQLLRHTRTPGRIDRLPGLMD